MSLIKMSDGNIYQVSGGGVKDLAAFFNAGGNTNPPPVRKPLRKTGKATNIGVFQNMINSNNDAQQEYNLQMQALKENSSTYDGHVFENAAEEKKWHYVPVHNSQLVTDPAFTVVGGQQYYNGKAY